MKNFNGVTSHRFHPQYLVYIKIFNMDDSLSFTHCDQLKCDIGLYYNKIITSMYPTLTWTSTQMQASTDGSVSCPILVTQNRE